jgi:hypothetical protein
LIQRAGCTEMLADLFGVDRSCHKGETPYRIRLASSPLR